jgi:hypothetical protein
MDKKILLLSQDQPFSKHIEQCLKEDMLNIESSNSFLEKTEYDFVIINLFSFEQTEEIEKQLNFVLKSDVDKIVLLENALNLYLNSKNSLPFSVYSKLIPKNDICKFYLEVERRITESKKPYVIFRISEIYGVSSPQSLVDKLLFKKSGEFENSFHDFIYDGDVLSAIEISLRKEVKGLFDIASGQSIELKRLVDLIKKTRQENNFDIRWKRSFWKKKLDIKFNCDNFKYYKWSPLVDIEMGLKTLFYLRRNQNDLSSSCNSRGTDQEF